MESLSCFGFEDWSSENEGYVVVLRLLLRFLVECCCSSFLDSGDLRMAMAYFLFLESGGRR